MQAKTKFLSATEQIAILREAFRLTAIELNMRPPTSKALKDASDK